MILSNDGIVEALSTNEFEMQPALDLQNLREVGIRVHLGSELLIPALGKTVDLGAKEAVEYQSYNLDLHAYTLAPGAFVLATLREKFKVNGPLIPILDGRSTLARLGITIHNSASLLDGCFDNWITPVLEIHNNGGFQIILRSDLAVAMVYFARLSSKISPPTEKSPYAGDGKGIAPRF